MSFSFAASILPMSDLRENLKKVKAQLKKTPVIITNKGRPDFGVCDLETLQIAARIKDFYDLLERRSKNAHRSLDFEEAFQRLEEESCA